MPDAPRMFVYAPYTWPSPQPPALLVPSTHENAPVLALTANMECALVDTSLPLT